MTTPFDGARGGASDPARASVASEFVPGVHAARAVAILLVLAAHTIGLWTNQEGFSFAPWQAYLQFVINPLRIDHQAGGHMGLLLFFLVSGYIVSQAADRDERTSFALKRAARLLPPMILAVFATLVVAKLDSGRGTSLPPEFDASRAYGWHAIAEAVGLGTVFGGIAVLFVLWTLYVEYQWYAMLWAAGDLGRRHPLATTLAFMLVLAALISFGPARLGPLTFTTDIGYVPILLVGRWLYVARDGRVSGRWVVGGVIGCVVMYGLTLWPSLGWDVLGGAHPRILPVLWSIAIFIALLAWVRGALWAPVRLTADVSYGLYLFHIPAMWLVLPVVSPGGHNFVVGLTLTLVLVYVAAWASYRFVETPIRRAVRRRLQDREVRGSAASPRQSADPAIP